MRTSSLYKNELTELAPGLNLDMARMFAKGRFDVSGKTEELKGRVKEAAGTLTGDDKLKQEGKTDQTVGKIKQNVEKVIDKVKDAVD